MMAVYCEEFESQVLLDLDAVISARTAPDGLMISYSCLCGRRGELIRGPDRRVVESGHAVRV